MLVLPNKASAYLSFRRKLDEAEAKQSDNF